jgi:HK97 family phage portal protein
MPILDFIVRNSIENPAVPISSANLLEAIGITGATAASGMEVTPTTSLSLPAFWRGINTLSGDLAKVPLLVQRTSADDGGKEPAKDHPAYRLLRRKPGLNLKPFIWKKTMFYHAISRGNGYSYIQRKGGLRFGEPIGFRILPPTPTTTPVVADGEQWYVTSLDNTQYRFPAEDVLHIQGLAFDGLEGLDVLTIMVDPLGLQIAQQKHTSKFFARGTQTVGFLTTPARLSDKDVKDMREGWSTMQTSIDNMHKVGLLYGGIDFKPLGIDPQKAQLIESREFGLIDLANILLMPPHKLGHPARTSYNSLEQENADYLQTTLDQWFVAMEEELEDKLLTEDEKDDDELDIEFNRKALLRVDFLTQVLGYDKYRAMGVMNANQISRQQNLPSQGPQGERFFVPANWVPVGDDGIPIPIGGRGQAGNTLSAEAIETHRAAIADRANQLAKVEMDKVNQAAKREASPQRNTLGERRGPFVEFVAQFYGQFAARLADAIEPAVAAFYASAGRSGATFAAYIAAQGYADQSRRDMLRVADTVQAAGLVQAVADAIQSWSGRADDLARWIVDHQV